MRLSNTKLAVVFFFCCLIAPAFVQGQEGPVEGSDCNPDDPDNPTDCDYDGTFMECFENKCRCENPDKTYFDEVDKECHRNVNEECAQMDKIECPFHGWCDTLIEPPYLCHCVPPYAETATKTCAIPYNGPCKVDLDCDRDAFIICDQGTKLCGCDSATSDYDEERKLCVLRLEQGCVIGEAAQECVGGASCQADDGSGFFCICQGGLDTVAGQCLVPMGGECDDVVRKCNGEKLLKCDLDGRCGCGRYGWYDTSLNICVGVAGAVCSTAVVSPPEMPNCERNSYCRNTTETGTDGICTCQYDMIPNPDGVCFLAPGQTCQPATDLCDTPGFQYCDPVSTKCTCKPVDPPQDLIEEGSNTCRLKAESACSDTKPPCTTNAQCSTGTCKCNDLLEINSVGKCTIPYNQPCTLESKETCNLEGFQYCNGETDKKCTCTDEAKMVFSTTDKTCYLKVDADCTGFESLCVPDSTCETNLCKCNEDFHDDGGLCVADP